VLWVLLILYFYVFEIKLKRKQMSLYLWPVWSKFEHHLGIF